MPDTPTKNMVVKTTSPKDQDGFEDPDGTVENKEIEDDDDDEVSEKDENVEGEEVRECPNEGAPPCGRNHAQDG